MKPMIYLLVSLTFLISAANGISLEEAYQQCKGTSQKDVDPCLLKLIQDLSPLIIQGIPELNLTTDDIIMNDLDFKEKSGDNFIQAIFFANKLRGFHELQLKKINIDYDNHKAYWEILLPEVFNSGKYKMDALILFFPLKGDGSCWFLWKNMVVKAVSEFTMMEINGDHRVQLVDTQFNFTFQNVTGRLNNLFDGDPLLSEAGAAFVSQNLDLIVEVLIPGIQKSFSPIVGKDLNMFLSHIPFDNMVGKEFLQKAFNLK